MGHVEPPDIGVVDQFMLIQMERHKRALYAASAQPRDTNVRA
jgi:hypothetical protein